LEYWTDAVSFGDALNLANHLGIKIHPDRISKRNLIIDLFQRLTKYQANGVRLLDDPDFRCRPVHRQAQQYYITCVQAMDRHQTGLRGTRLAVCKRDRSECMCRID
jgi:hypothetical protein